MRCCAVPQKYLSENNFKNLLTIPTFCGIIYIVRKNKHIIGILCNGSTADSDSVCWGSNPYIPARKKALAKAGAFFRYIRLRRVLLLRSDIRLTPGGIRFSSFPKFCRCIFIFRQIRAAETIETFTTLRLLKTKKLYVII